MTNSRIRTASKLAVSAIHLSPIIVIFLIPLTVAGLSVYNVGMITTEKMKLQNAADNAAYSPKQRSREQ